MNWKEHNYKRFVTTISKPSNFILKITIIEGWSKTKLTKLLESFFVEFREIKYEEILADTYYLQSYETFNQFFEKLKNQKKQIKKIYQDHELHNQYSFDELMIIGSLLEREGKDSLDKK